MRPSFLPRFLPPAGRSIPRFSILRSPILRSPILRLTILLLLAALLAGCAGNARLKEVRAFAAEAPKLNGYAELSQRYRDTYQREQPYLSPAADRREQAIDAQRRAAYPDLVAIHEAVVAYLRTLGKLAGGDQFDPGDQIKDVAKGIKAWPDTGLTDRHVNAVSGLARLLARIGTGRAQDQAVQDMLRDGYEPLRDSLDAMSTVLRYYDKNHDNEQAIVIGMLETEIPFADSPQERLLAALAKAHRQDKLDEYRLLGRRHTLARQHVQAIRDRHEALYRGLAPAPADPQPAARVAANQAGGTP
ncbi:hypothetical protein [Pseudoduganella albidiflava]|uniref:hypothetical protein n=1 Tax=Pseudoduganella albidiflava TaxID=321983 RepID=UPI001580CC6C|nr:hypothetical protein [Pseudoduganella albidiflava]